MLVEMRRFPVRHTQSGLGKGALKFGIDCGETIVGARIMQYLRRN